MRWNQVAFAFPAVFGLVFCALLTMGNAQDKGNQKDTGTQKDKGTGDTGKSGQTFQGRISKVDSDKKQITLSDVRGGTGTGTGSGTTDKGTTDKGTTDKGTTDKGTTDKGGSDKGTDTGKGQQMVFSVGDATKITLDGKEATMRDLKEGLTARVTARAQGSGGAEKDRGTKDRTESGSGDNKDKGTTGQGQGHAMMADRIEAFTKAP